MVESNLIHCPNGHVFSKKAVWDRMSLLQY